MALYIITGNYTSSGLRSLVANPSDREAAVKTLIEAAGGKLRAFLFTTGEADFHMTVESDDIQSMLASLMVAGASGSATNFKTVQAFTSAEFLAAQKRAGTISTHYKAPG
jgi:uncharacterized protein with GYD domain